MECRRQATDRPIKNGRVQSEVAVQYSGVPVFRKKTSANGEELRTIVIGEIAGTPNLHAYEFRIDLLPAGSASASRLG
jgi:hypothetical protein